MEKSPESFQRFDSLVRSERYFTATLLPAVLFHSNPAGIQRFVELVDEKTKTECNKLGQRVPKVAPTYDFQDVEVITEFHISRDLRFARLVLEEDEKERRDAPDVVIVAGQELVVCEGKFFSEFGQVDLNEQLRSQRRQVRHLFHHRAQLRAYRHVAILPFVPEWPVDADAVLTWDNIRNLAEELLGLNHYVTLRLRNAVERYNSKLPVDPSVRNYDEKLSFEKMCEKCQERGDKVWVGHEGGTADLHTRTLDYVAGKRWKCRDKGNRGYAVEKNWLPGTHWLEIVDGLKSDVI